MLKVFATNSHRPTPILKAFKIYYCFSKQTRDTTSYFCSVLGLKKNFTQQQLKSAYLQMVKKYHPDLSKQPNAAQKFQQVQKAYDFLQNPMNSSYNQSEQKNYTSQQQQEKRTSAQQFNQKFGVNFDRKRRVDESMQFSYNLYKKHYQQVQQKKKQYKKHYVQKDQVWIHKNQKQDNNYKGIGVGAVIIGLIVGSIYFVNS